jgi:hypothetical protein
VAGRQVKAGWAVVLQVYDVEPDDIRVHQDLAGVFEVHGDTGPDHALDLAEAPCGLVRVADVLAGFVPGVVWTHD